jgi:hypothetical protein
VGRLLIQEEVAIVIQGPIRINPSTMENAWKGYNIIWSTWQGEKVESEFPVFYNVYPSYFAVKNLALQVQSTMVGLYFAKDVGFKYALKWRSDMLPTNLHFMNLFRLDCMNVFYWCNCDAGYYTDYFTFGTVDEQLRLWDIKFPFEYKFPEEALTKKLESFRVNCIGDGITIQNEIFWTRPNGIIPLSTYKQTGNFEVRNTI